VFHINSNNINNNNNKNNNNNVFRLGNSNQSHQSGLKSADRESGLENGGSWALVCK